MAYRRLENNHRMRHRLATPEFHNHQHAHGRQRQQQAHFHIQARREQETAHVPLIALVAEQRSKKTQHREAIIKTAQQKDTVKPFG